MKEIAASILGKNNKKELINLLIDKGIEYIHYDVMDGNFVRIMSWYDNEWGFSNRMLDTAAIMAKFL